MNNVRKFLLQNPNENSWVETTSALGLICSEKLTNRMYVKTNSGLQLIYIQESRNK